MCRFGKMMATTQGYLNCNARCLMPAPFVLRARSVLLASARISIKQRPQQTCPSIKSSTSQITLELQLASRPFATMAPNPIERLADRLEKPDIDDRSYRVIKLPNELEAFLVHDADTDKASASVSVDAGSFSDADDMPGMAHAVEHLLFMGTQKVDALCYPLVAGHTNIHPVSQRKRLQSVPIGTLRSLERLHCLYTDELLL